MELYREFFNLIDALNQEGLEYSVVGGIALAFHSQPRFTRDIDILARPGNLASYEKILQCLGYARFSEPWTLPKTNIELHRFAKRSQEDAEEMIFIDLLLGHANRHHQIIDRSLVDESRAGRVRIATKEDLIWLKKLRNSKQDQADIEKLSSSK
jgi:hypothetical protein